LDNRGSNKCLFVYHIILAKSSETPNCDTKPCQVISVKNTNDAKRLVDRIGSHSVTKISMQGGTFTIKYRGSGNGLYFLSMHPPNNEVYMPYTVKFSDSDARITAMAWHPTQ
jgi:hypothetical protein